MSGNLSGLPYQSQVSSTKKVAIPCIRREVTNNSSAQNLYLPNARTQIPLETGTPGQFIDPMLSYLRFDLTVINPNPCVDFFDLPRIGFAAFIRELTVEVNGMPTEQYRYYNDTCSCRAITDGSFPEVWNYYVENDWRPMKGIAGPFHVNFIKPCMISRSGFSMYSETREIMNGLKGSAHSAQANSSQGFEANDTDVSSFRDLACPLAQKPIDVPPSFSYREGPTYLTGVRQFFPEIIIDVCNRHQINYYNSVAGITARYGVYSRSTGGTMDVLRSTVGAPALRDYASDLIDDPAARPAAANAAGTFIGTRTNTDYAVAAGVVVAADGLHQNDTYFLTTANPTLLDLTENGARCRFPLWRLHEESRISDLASDISHTEAETSLEPITGDVRVGEVNRYAQPCPARWPIHYNPFDYEKLKQRNYLDKCRVPEEFERLSAGNNVKNIPIGFESYTRGGIKRSRFQVFLPLESVLIGNRAQSWFPATLIPQGKMRLNIVWEEPRKAFQVTMDPCRLLNNTLRVRGINVGLLNAELNGRADLLLNTGNEDPATATKFSGVHSSMILIPHLNAAGNAVDTSVYYNFNGACAMGAYAIPSLMLAEAVTGEFYTPRRLVGVSTGTYSNRGVAIADTGDPEEVWGPTLPVDYWRGVMRCPELIVNNEKTGYKYPGSRQCWSNTCHPTPQSLPYRAGTAENPLLFDTSFDDIVLGNFVSETQLIYGTFLEASQPQTRRCMSSLVPLVHPAPSYMSQELTYEISNLSYDTVEYLLPESATASITMLALETGLQQEIDTVKLQQQFLAQAETQKPLINGSSSYVNSISVFFRHQHQTQVSRAFGYNSFSFLNPFASLTVEETAYEDVGGLIRMKTELNLARNTGIRVQIQIGGEYIPRVPIDDVYTLMRKTMEGDSEFQGMLHHKHFAPFTVPADRGPDSYPTIQLLQDGFWAPFIPLEALDDQTCTANPYWIPYEMDLVAARSSDIDDFRANLQSKSAGRLRARRPPTLTNFAATGFPMRAVLPIFKPLDGTFHLSFNLRTFVQSPQLRSGVAIVNNNLFLLMNKAYACADSVLEMLTLFHCEGRVVYERGGNISIFS
jgi:hypothetical protein